MYSNGNHVKGVDSYWEDYSNIREYFNDGAKNAILLVPSLGKNPQTDTLLLIPNTGFDDFMKACLATLRSRNHVPASADFDKIIIAAHSAGGKPLSIILGSSSHYKSKIIECWGFDCLYTDSWAEPISNWAIDDKIFYHYWAWSCSANNLQQCPRVIGDRFHKTNPTNFKNIEPVGKVSHQSIIQHAWTNQINKRNWFSDGSSQTYRTPQQTSNSADIYSKMNLQQIGLSSEAFRIAFNGYMKLRQSGQLANDRILTIADFTQSSKMKRLYVLNLSTQTVLIQTNVAHGNNGTAEWATKFSNTPGSHMSSLGFYVTQETFKGKKNGLSLYIY